VARSQRVPGAQPWLEFRNNRRLNPRLEIEGIGALVEPPPFSGLADAPSQEIERADLCGKRAQMMAAESEDTDIVEIRAPHADRAIVRLQDGTPVVIVES